MQFSLDLSSTTDITAFVLMFPPAKELMKLVLEKKIASAGIRFCGG